MEDIKKSIIKSLDGLDIELIPYLTYILQDLWEIGADPSTMLALIKNNIKRDSLRILDLGCGKGAVSIHIAREMDCKVKGIDAMPDFIKSAKKYAIQYDVHDKCDFETGDIRIKIKELKGFDVIILGAIGPIFGDLFTTLSVITKSLKPSGYVLLDDGFIPDESKSDYQSCLRKTDFYSQIANAGFKIIQEEIFMRDTIVDTDKIIYDLIEKRINELINWNPDKKELFTGYLKSQEYENHMLANEIITGTWLLQL